MKMPRWQKGPVPDPWLLNSLFSSTQSYAAALLAVDRIARRHGGVASHLGDVGHAFLLG